MINNNLTAGERRVLEAISNEDAEPLTQSIPGGWWLDDERISGRIGWSLLRKCLIKTVCHSDDYFLYRTNEEGKKALADPDYVPLIVRHMRGENISNAAEKE